MFTALMTLMSVGSSLMGIRAKNKQLTSQAQAAADASVTQANRDLSVLSLRQKQESDKITLDEVRRFRQGARERGSMAAVLGDAGVAGGSTLRDAVTSFIQEDMDVGTLEASKGDINDQLLLEKQGVIARGKSGVNQAQSLLNQRTSGTAGVLQLIGAGVSGYSQGKRLEPMFSGGSSRNPATPSPQRIGGGTSFKV